MNRRGFWIGLLVGLVIVSLIVAVAGVVVLRLRGTAPLRAWREGRVLRGGGRYGRVPMFGMARMFFMPGPLLFVGALVLAFLAGRHWSHHHHHEHWRRDCCAGEHTAPQPTPVVNEPSNTPPPSQA